MSDSHRFTWRLKDLMHANGIHQISALQRELQNHGIDLSSSQTHRLVTSTPDRLNLEVLSALCEVLSCSPSGLIGPRSPRTKTDVGCSQVCAMCPLPFHGGGTMPDGQMCSQLLALAIAR